MRRSLWPNPLARSLRTAAAYLCLPLLATNPAPAQTTNPAADTEQLRQAELRQSQIRQQTQLAAEQLDQIITDFETNGLGEGDDVKLLRQLHGMLGRLTSEQMQQVIVLLQQARATPDSAIPTARDAYDRQQRILVEFRRVLAEYQKTQSTYALAARVRQLMERQQMALRASIDLADALGEKLTAEPDARARESLAVQATEQQALAGELDDLLRQLATLAATPAAPGASLQTDSARLSQALALARELGTLDTMRQAGSHLQQNALFRAGNLQRDSRDGLRKIWRQVGPPRDRLQQLSDAALELQQHLEMQTAVRQLTASAPDKPAYLATKRRQGDLIDRTGMTQSDLETLLPSAADLTRDALREMRRARQRIDQNEKSAPQSQTAAYDLLVKARDEVLRAITEEQTRQDQQASRPLQDRLERVEEALKQVEELKKKQDALATTPPTPFPAPNTPPNTPPNSPPTPATPTSRAEQAKLETESRELAAQISSDNPAAARELSEAAQDMRNAQQQMRDAPNEPSAPRADQQQASQDLQQAKQELERQAQELRDAQAQLDRVTAAQERVDQVMQQQAQASQSAADAAQNPTPESQQQQSQRAAEQQQQARDATTAAQEQVRQASPEAAQSMRQAPAPMSEAQKDLQADKPAEARPDQNRAEQALAETQDQLARDADRLREQLDQPSDDALQAERAAQAMKAAAESAQNAEQQMGQEKSPTEPSASEMAKQAQSLESSDAKNGQATPAQTRSAMQSAAEELRQGASAARAGNRPQAAQSAQRAREQLAQGQRALEEAQARAAELAQQQSQSSLQPSQQQNPNSKDGQNPSPNQADPNRNAQSGGPRSNEDGSSSFLGLPARDRQALQQSQSEKYPEEYSAIVEQYLRNLSQRPK